MEQRVHRQWTFTSDETRESERRLASQIASHVTASGNAENIRLPKRRFSGP